ncbi:hypothetical protein [Kribbella sp. CA-247076]|uniref:hypothetical protein n=1 Tax=Kribbella sp. CA-247076 TaxID=3239941 RepID=UPI003D8E9091
MDTKRFIITASVLVAAGLALPVAGAAAKVPPEDPRPVATVPYEPGPPNYPAYDPAHEVAVQTAGASNDSSSDGIAVEALEAGASAAGGAAVAFAVTWLYRRRQIPTAHG